MREFVLGTSEVTYTIGVTYCDQRGTHLPFLAFGPKQIVARELHHENRPMLMQGEADVRRTYEVFQQHGTVIWFDNLSASERLLGLVSILLDRACETDWVNRTWKPEVVQ